MATLPDAGDDRQGPTDAAGRFVLLYTRHQREIRAYIAALVGNWAEADEVMAETSLALWNQFDRYDPTRSFGAWACGVAFHRVLRRRRALGRDRHEFGGAFEAAAERAAARMESEADRLGARTAALESCLGKLPEADRGLLESAYRGDSTIRDLAGRLGRPAKAVYKTLARIRAVLVACVEKTLAEADDPPAPPGGPCMSGRNGNEDREFRELVSRACDDGGLPPEDQRRLEALAGADDARFALLLDMFRLHAELQDRLGSAGKAGTVGFGPDPVFAGLKRSASCEPAPELGGTRRGADERFDGPIPGGEHRHSAPRRDGPPSGGAGRVGRFPVVGWLAVAAGLAACAALAVGLLWGGSTEGPPDPGRGGTERLPAVAARPTAVLQAAAGCVWSWPSDGGADAGAPEPGSPFPPGRVALRAGLAEIRLAAGAVLVVESPAEFEVLGDNAAYLHAGRLVARVPASAIGFSVDTPAARIVDLGTEFGVGCDGAGVTTAQVYVGAIETRGRSADAAGRRLAAGQAASISADRPEPVAVEFREDRFVRRFPDPDARGPFDRHSPYNRPRWDAVHIVPAPGPVTADGDLSDWDLSGAFESACSPPYAGDYRLRAAMMFDDRNLYLAAEVADPDPMRNRYSADDQPDFAWRGGAVQVRLSLDRSGGWPASADSRRLPRRPEDVSDRIVHLTLFHSASAGRAMLYVDRGMDYHGGAADPPGTRTACVPLREEPSGRARGYRLEYAVPWAALTDDPPRGGDVTAASWTVHWSYPDGRQWRGQLVEVVAPGAQGWPFQQAAVWGKAVWHRSGRLPPGTVKPMADHLPAVRIGPDPPRPRKVAPR